MSDIAPAAFAMGRRSVEGRLSFGPTATLTATDDQDGFILVVTRRAGSHTDEALLELKLGFDHGIRPHLQLRYGDDRLVFQEDQP